MNKMKNLFISLCLVGASALTFGQATLSSTTFSVAVTDSKSRFVTLASATAAFGPGVANNNTGIGSPSTFSQYYLVADTEVMRVTGAPNGNVVPVERGFNGSVAASHLSGTKVWVGPGNYFSNGTGSGNFVTIPSGSCTRALFTAVPRVIAIGPGAGRLFDCGTNSQIVTFDGNQLYASEGTVIASATTIAPLNPVVHVSGTTSIATITVPPACPQYFCQITIIPDGIFATTTAGNIALISTSVVNKALVMSYDFANSKWVPSY